MGPCVANADRAVHLRIVAVALAASLFFIAGLLAAAAEAADLPALPPAYNAPEPAAAPLQSWTDFYVGAQSGHGWGPTRGAASSLGGTAPASAFTPTYAFNVEADWLASVHGRTDWGRFGPLRDDLDRAPISWTAGAGAAQARPRKWSAKVEELNFHAVRFGLTRRFDPAR
ncbi:MAG TPA: hypothetical protein VKD43_18765 [Xanthobacteraceae bacterium]|nr:hypothetical protein [Xanthobacteraceae bacterium]